MMYESSLIVRAVDVGFGNVKATDGLDENNIPICMMFPSVAPVASDKSLTAEVLGKRKVVKVKVKGTQYEVGEDATISRVGYGKNLDEHYSTSDTYTALLYGAISMMDLPARRIDMLVLGLPISTYEKKKDALSAKFVGTHDLGNGKVIEIGECKVVPQPIGGFYDYAMVNGVLRDMMSQTTLIIDPGYFTLDWVVTHGNKPIDSRCGAADNGGMAKVLEAIAEAMSKDLDNIGDVTRLDMALRTNNKLTVYGQAIDLAKYIPAATPVIEEAVNKMMHSVGNMADIDNIILIGGGSRFYYETIQNRVKQKIHRNDPQYAATANVRGFHFVGAEFARRKARAVTLASIS